MRYPSDCLGVKDSLSKPFKVSPPLEGLHLPFDARRRVKISNKGEVAARVRLVQDAAGRARAALVYGHGYASICAGRMSKEVATCGKVV